ncbi:alpha/beta hydrolase family protein [Bacillus solitudinis]|uniref:alpha/beta hydrolase family protein n=1 Tax=Bacillus solitudinis TaxID=2014074 RepID=UPI000C23A1A5|nr:alpha/beta hydrolase [Bacillus solitudinis]
MEERAVIFEHKGSVHGTLLKPTSTERSPAILLLPGSGPLNRDGNKGRMKLNLYNKLTEALTQLGFVTLRYDKRGTGKSKCKFLEVGFWDLVEEAKSALDFLKEQSFVDESKVFIVAHSEGAMIAPAVVKHNPVAGLILLSGAAETLHEAMVYQRSQIVKELKDVTGIKGKLLSWLKVVNKIEKQGPKFDKKMIETEKDVIRFQGVRYNAKWFREHYHYNLIGTLKEISCPVLALTGSKDLQVTPERVYDIHKLVQGETTAEIIKDMNHMLRYQEKMYSMLELKKAYKGMGKQPISPRLIEAVDNWLRRYV